MRDDHIEKIKQGDSKTFYLSTAWRSKRLEILDRDNNECQECKANGEVTVNIVDTEEKKSNEQELVVHHIKELKDHPELGLEDDNLITLCHHCHNVIHDRFEGKAAKIDIPERW